MLSADSYRARPSAGEGLRSHLLFSSWIIRMMRAIIWAPVLLYLFLSLYERKILLQQCIQNRRHQGIITPCAFLGQFMSLLLILKASRPESSSLEDRTWEMAQSPSVCNGFARSLTTSGRESSANPAARKWWWARSCSTRQVRMPAPPSSSLMMLIIWGCAVTEPSAC